MEGRTGWSGLRGLLLSLVLRRAAALRFFILLSLYFSLLALLHPLCLLSVLLLHLLHLLLLAALELLLLPLPLIIRPLSFQFLLFLDLPLLHLLPRRILLPAHLFYFSLLLLFHTRIDARGIPG